MVVVVERQRGLVVVVRLHPPPFEGVPWGRERGLVVSTNHLLKERERGLVVVVVVPPTTR